MASSSSSYESSENLPPRTLARVSREVRDLMKSPPEGVKLLIDQESGMPSSLAELVAEIEGPTGTPYADRFFRLKLSLPSEFPSCPPRGFFTTKIYHPNVDNSTGAICVNTLKKDWTPETSFRHVLSVIRCLLIVPFPESSLNDEAGRLFMDSYEEYARRAKLMAKVHGRPQSFDKKETNTVAKENKHANAKSNSVKSKSASNNNGLDSGNILKQSNTTGTNSLQKCNATAGGVSKTTNKSRITDKKIKKKSLRRL